MSLYKELKYGLIIYYSSDSSSSLSSSGLLNSKSSLIVFVFLLFVAYIYILLKISADNIFYLK